MKDIVLETIVDIVNSNKLDIDITLVASGVVVSGTIISVDKYFEHTPYTKKMKEIWDKADKSETEPQETESPEPKTPYYIHLKNAQIFTPGQMPMPQEGTFMRFSIENISGFSFGKFQVN